MMKNLAVHIVRGQSSCKSGKHLQSLQKDGQHGYMTQRSQIDSNYPIPLAAVERLGRAEAVKGTQAPAGLLSRLE